MKSEVSSAVIHRTRVIRVRFSAMGTRTKIYISIATVVTLSILGGSLWSSYKFLSLERTVETHKQTAGQKEQLAAEKELEAAAYKQKIEYLESQLADIRNLATKQDEELEILTDRTSSARSNVERARRTRAAAATAAELCEKLAQVGHPCDD